MRKLVRVRFPAAGAERAQRGSAEAGAVCLPTRHFKSQSQPVHCTAIRKARRGICLGAKYLSATCCGSSKVAWRTRSGTDKMHLHINPTLADCRCPGHPGIPPRASQPAIVPCPPFRVSEAGNTLKRVHRTTAVWCPRSVSTLQGVRDRGHAEACTPNQKAWGEV